MGTKLKIMNKHGHSIAKLTLRLKQYAYLMSFNSILVVGLNASILLFGYMAFAFSKWFNYKPQYYIQWLALLFFAGALISIADIDTYDHLAKALQVMPNYLYWIILIIVLVNLRNNLPIEQMSYGVLFGLITTLIIYQIQDIGILGFLKRNTPNSYSFILICFGAISVVACNKRFNLGLAFSLLLLLVLSLLLEGRRAGLVLVGMSSIFSLFIKQINIKYLAGIIIIGFAGALLLQLEIIETAIQKSNTRIYELIYETENITKADQSYLTRRMMIERGLHSFNDNPLNGVGINNYTNIETEDEGNFIGAELILQKTDGKTFSAHNSYIVLLVEGGMLLIIPFILILLFNLYHFVIAYNKRTQIENAFYWSFAAMVIHIYFISEILNVYAWFLIGVVSAISMKYKIKTFVSASK